MIKKALGLSSSVSRSGKLIMNRKTRFPNGALVLLLCFITFSSLHIDTIKISNYAAKFCKDFLNQEFPDLPDNDMEKLQL